LKQLKNNDLQKAVLFLLIACNISVVNGKELKDTLYVSKNNSSNFTTIAAAIESLPMYCYERVVIFVKNGIYNEKIKIDRDYVTIVGESREGTRIEFTQLRQNWNNNKDDIGPAVVNIFADDIIIRNLTIENTQPEIGPHAFAIYGTGTRTILKNCNVLSKGGDTVSLWNYKTGMYYHDSCYFQGAVDFVCPRGWCYISNSTFYELTNTAAIWHAAPTNSQQKFVLNSCEFQGADSFYLARHHYDAQFYFLNCTFPPQMINKPIEHVVYKNKPEKTRPYLYGDRYYFFNCTRDAGNYKWFTDNLRLWSKNITLDSITPKWTFDYKWNPLDTSAIILLDVSIKDNKLFLWFNVKVQTIGEVQIETATGKKLVYLNGNGRERLEFVGEGILVNEDVIEALTLEKGQIQNIEATVCPRKANKVFKKIG